MIIKKRKEKNALERSFFDSDFRCTKKKTLFYALSLMPIDLEIFHVNK